MAGVSSEQLISSVLSAVVSRSKTEPTSRWHLAFVQFYCARAFLLPTKNSVPSDKISSLPSYDVTHCMPVQGSQASGQNSIQVSRSPPLSHTAIDIKRDNDEISSSPSYDIMDYMPVQCSTSYLVTEIEPVDDKMSSSPSPSHDVPPVQGSYTSVLNSDQVSRPSLYSANEREPGDHPPFKICQAILVKIVKEKDLDHLNKLGGVERIVSALESDPEKGICGDVCDVGQRQKTFGSNNIFDVLPTRTYLPFLWEAIKECNNVLYLACAAVSFFLWISKHGPKEGWCDGASNFFSVLVAIANFSFINFWKYRNFIHLTKISNNIETDVVRNGRRQLISIYDIVIGDVVFLKIGDRVPADGLLLNGHYLQVDESSLIGEREHVEVNSSHNPFLFSGSKVTDGYAQMVVTSVGMNTMWGEMVTLVTCHTNEQTPLQLRLKKLNSLIVKFGLVVFVLFLVASLVCFFTGNTVDENEYSKFNNSWKMTDHTASSVAAIISTAFTILEVTIPEGLSLAVPQTLANSLKRTLSDHVLVIKLSAYETLAFATTVCIDETATLTWSKVKVNKLWLGEEQMTEDNHFQVSPDILDLIKQGVALNTTGDAYKAASRSEFDFSGSPTEKAILSWAACKLNMDVELVKEGFSILEFKPFSPQERSRVYVRNKSNNTIHVHWKGAAEIILKMCTMYYDASGTVKEICHHQREFFERVIAGMASSKLGCIGFAYKEFPELALDEEHKLQEKNLTLLGLLGLENFGWQKKAVQYCQRARVNVKIITGDNISSAKATAIECGILSSDQDQTSESVIEGVAFQTYSPEEMEERVEKICVMASSLPGDKLLMIKHLREKGHVVVVIGGGTGDASALEQADIRISMGIQGNEVAKKSSDIVILDDDFVSVVAALKWGRCVYYSIQKLIEFQLTSNVVALVINFVVAISAGNTPLTAVQLLWINLIRTTLSAFGLASMKPTNKLLDMPPVDRHGPLINNIMLSNLLAQASYQIAVLLTLQFKSESTFGVNEKVKNTLIFNTFVFCQIFNELNAMEHEKPNNVLKGMRKNKLFWWFMAVTIFLQVVMVEFLKKFANTERLNWEQWIACIGTAAVSWLIGWIVKCIPVPEKPILSYLIWNES